LTGSRRARIRSRICGSVSTAPRCRTTIATIVASATSTPTSPPEGRSARPSVTRLRWAALHTASTSATSSHCERIARAHSRRRSAASSATGAAFSARMPNQARIGNPMTMSAASSWSASVSMGRAVYPAPSGIA
jgi:hypothetical protein